MRPPQLQGREGWRSEPETIMSSVCGVRKRKPFKTDA
jgi:hypothetical protein